MAEITWRKTGDSHKTDVQKGGEVETFSLYRWRERHKWIVGKKMHNSTSHKHTKMQMYENGKGNLFSIDTVCHCVTEHQTITNIFNFILLEINNWDSTIVVS